MASNGPSQTVRFNDRQRALDVGRNHHRPASDVLGKCSCRVVTPEIDYHLIAYPEATCGNESGDHAGMMETIASEAATPPACSTSARAECPLENGAGVCSSGMVRRMRSTSRHSARISFCAWAGAFSSFLVLWLD